MLLHTTISSLLYLIKPMGTHNWLVLWSRNHVPNTVMNYGVIQLHHSINPNWLLQCFLRGRWLGLNTFPSKGHVSSVPLRWPPLSVLRRWCYHILSRILQQYISFSCALSSISRRFYCCNASSKEDGSVLTHSLAKAMYPVYLSGDLLYLCWEDGAPTFSLTSSNNMSASLVRFRPSLEDSTWVDVSTPRTSTCSCSTSVWGSSSLGTNSSSTTYSWSSLSRETCMAFCSSNLRSLQTTVLRLVGKYTL